MEISNQLPTHILNHLLNNEEFCRRVIPYIKPEYFESTHKTVFDMIVKFVQQTNKLPTSKVLQLELGKISAPDEILNSANQLIDQIAVKTDVDTEYLIKESEKWCRDRAVYNAIMESIQIIDGNEKEKTDGAIPEILSEALGVSFDQAIGHDYIDNSAERFEFYNKKEDRIPEIVHICKSVSTLHLIDLSQDLYNITKNIRQTVSEDIMISTSVLKIIEKYASFKA